jgi:hypothetical protein
VRVPTGTLGRIVAGANAGWFVEVVDDDATGGFLILTHESPDRRGNGYDSWVESREAMERYFLESGWSIDWPEETT